MMKMKIIKNNLSELLLVLASVYIPLIGWGNLKHYLMSYYEMCFKKAVRERLVLMWSIFLLQ